MADNNTSKSFRVDATQKGKDPTRSCTQMFFRVADEAAAMRAARESLAADGDDPENFIYVTIADAVNIFEFL